MTQLWIMTDRNYRCSLQANCRLRRRMQRVGHWPFLRPNPGQYPRQCVDDLRNLSPSTSVLDAAIGRRRQSHHASSISYFERRKNARRVSKCHCRFMVWTVSQKTTQCYLRDDYVKCGAILVIRWLLWSGIINFAYKTVETPFATSWSYCHLIL